MELYLFSDLEEAIVLRGATILNRSRPLPSSILYYILFEWHLTFVRAYLYYLIILERVILIHLAKIKKHFYLYLLLKLRVGRTFPNHAADASSMCIVTYRSRLESMPVQILNFRSCAIHMWLAPLGEANS